MKNKNKLITSVLLFCLAFLSLSHAKTAKLAAIDWQGIRKAYGLFLLKPSSNHANKLSKLIPNELKPEEPENPGRAEAFEYIFEADRIAHFANIVSKGKPAYMKLVFQMANTADSGRSEQLEAMLGLCAAVNPDGFLKTVQNATDFQLRGILGNFTGEYVDENDRQTAELKARYNAIEKVKKKRYAQIRRRCLDIIKVFIQERETMKIQGE